MQCSEASTLFIVQSQLPQLQNTNGQRGSCFTTVKSAASLYDGARYVQRHTTRVKANDYYSLRLDKSNYVSY